MPWLLKQPDQIQIDPKEDESGQIRIESKGHESGFCTWLHFLEKQSNLRVTLLASKEKQQQRKEQHDAMEQFDEEHAMKQFKDDGFSDRFAFCLNASVPKRNGHDCSFELRTLSTAAIDDILPAGHAVDMLHKAAAWTDLDGIKKQFDPFISLTIRHAKGSDEMPTHEETQTHKHIHNQLINKISSMDGAAGHLGVDQKLHFREEEYAW